MAKRDWISKNNRLCGNELDYDFIDVSKHYECVVGRCVELHTEGWMGISDRNSNVGTGILVHWYRWNRDVRERHRSDLHATSNHFCKYELERYIYV